MKQLAEVSEGSVCVLGRNTTPPLTGHICEGSTIDTQTHANTLEARWKLGGGRLLLFSDSVHTHAHFAVIISLVVEH